MTTSITTTTANTSSITAAATSTTSNTSAGLSSVSSSISLAAADNQGFSAQISAWIASVVDSIRSCFAKLPLIGSWFDKAGATTSGTTVPLSSTTAWSDAELVNMIRAQFVAAPASTTTSTTSVAVPAADVVAYTVNLFTQIQSPVSKMEALRDVLCAVNSTDDIARQFYNALPEGNGGIDSTRSSFRSHIWTTNGRNDNGYGTGFGDHIIGTAPRGPLAQQAAQNLHTALAAAVTTSTSTSTTTAATTTTTAATTTTTVARAADAGFINRIRNILTAAEAGTTTVGVADIATIVNLFTQIQSPLTKLDAFQMLLTANSSTDAIAQQCYNVLPEGAPGAIEEASKTAFRHQMWEANARSDGGHGLNFANHVMGTAPRGLLAQAAAQNLRTSIAANS